MKNKKKKKKPKEMDSDASMTRKVANGVKRRLIKARNSISNFIGIDDVFEDD